MNTPLDRTTDTPRTDALFTRHTREAGALHREHTGSPIACARALAVLALEQVRELLAHARELEREMAQAKLPVIGECEECGHKIVTPLSRL